MAWVGTAWCVRACVESSILGSAAVIAVRRASRCASTYLDLAYPVVTRALRRCLVEFAGSVRERNVPCAPVRISRSDCVPRRRCGRSTVFPLQLGGADLGRGGVRVQHTDVSRRPHRAELERHDGNGDPGAPARLRRPKRRLVHVSRRAHAHEEGDRRGAPRDGQGRRDVRRLSRRRAVRRPGLRLSRRGDGAGPGRAPERSPSACTRRRRNPASRRRSSPAPARSSTR